MDATSKEKDKLLRRSHLPAMIFQVESLSQLLGESDDQVWQRLAFQNPSILYDMVVRLARCNKWDESDAIQGVLNLYRRYVREWDAVRTGFSEEIAAALNIDYIARN